jgi:hypothetical protein
METYTTMFSWELHAYNHIDSISCRMNKCRRKTWMVKNINQVEHGWESEGRMKRSIKHKIQKQWYPWRTESGNFRRVNSFWPPRYHHKQGKLNRFKPNEDQTRHHFFRVFSIRFHNQGRECNFTLTFEKSTTQIEPVEPVSIYAWVKTLQESGSHITPHPIISLS